MKNIILCHVCVNPPCTTVVLFKAVVMVSRFLDASLSDRKCYQVTFEKRLGNL